MSISRDDVQKVALLARLMLTEQELSQMTSEMAQIVGYVDQLADVETEDVEPMAHPLDVDNVFAEDQLRESLSREEALKNAPNSDGEYFLVPAVLGD